MGGGAGVIPDGFDRECGAVPVFGFGKDATVSISDPLKTYCAPERLNYLQ